MTYFLRNRDPPTISKSKNTEIAFYFSTVVEHGMLGISGLRMFFSCKSAQKVTRDFFANAAQSECSGENNYFEYIEFYFFPPIVFLLNRALLAFEDGSV